MSATMRLDYRTISQVVKSARQEMTKIICLDYRTISQVVKFSVSA